MSSAKNLYTAQNTLAMARELSLPAPVLALLDELAPRLPWAELSPRIDELTAPSLAEQARQALAGALAPLEGDTGMVQLACMLAAAGRTHARYRAAGVADPVFYATMDCFRRFLEETHGWTGRWVFDRAFWCWRQTSCLLFRLGALEFECTAAPGDPPPPGLAAGDPLLSVHIPSDAPLTRAALDASYAEQRRFFAAEGAAFCTQGAPRALFCSSWLLAPALTRFLGEQSGIRQFAGDYRVYHVDEANESFYLWLYGGRKPIPDLPTRTHLQRAVQAHLAAGGKVGEGAGLLAL